MDDDWNYPHFSRPAFCPYFVVGMNELPTTVNPPFCPNGLPYLGWTLGKILHILAVEAEFSSRRRDARLREVVRKQTRPDPQEFRSITIQSQFTAVQTLWKTLWCKRLH